MQRSIDEGTVGHAYMIEGERDSGKKMVANTFAMTIQCERGETEPCLECHSCRQAMSANHPDIITIHKEKEDSKTLGVDEIREQLVNDVMIKPYSRERKVYIIPDAQDMTIQAQNALLKTLEEPPEYVVIILLTINSMLLLPTIISRCVILNIRPIPDDRVRRFLMESLKLPDYHADLCASFARGNIGKAVKLAADDGFLDMKDEVTGILKNIHEMEADKMIRYLETLSKYTASAKKKKDKEKETIERSTEYGPDDIFELMRGWFRDVLLYKSTGSTEGMIFSEEIKGIRQFAYETSFEGIERSLRAIDDAREKLKANGNPEFIMELLLLTIKEN